MQAAIAELTHASIGTADIDWAQIKDLTTDTAIIEKGVNGKLYVADLAVTEANMASLSVGELLIRGEDDCFYAISIAPDGSVKTEKRWFPMRMSLTRPSQEASCWNRRSRPGNST